MRTSLFRRRLPSTGSGQDATGWIDGFLDSWIGGLAAAAGSDGLAAGWIDGFLDCWINGLGIGGEWLHGCIVTSAHGPV